MITAVAMIPFRASAKTDIELKIALLPIFDVLPFYVAEANGYLSAPGIRITALPVGSAMERDQLLQSGQIDGVINECISAASFNRNRIAVQVVAVARSAMPGSPLFRILGSPDSGFDSVTDLAGVPIGVSLNTIIEYVTDRILTDQGLPAAAITMQSVPVIPERFQLLLQGRIRAAVIPDPLAGAAILAGARQIMDDTDYARYSTSTVTLSRHAIDTKDAAVRLLMNGWFRAAADINDDPEAYRALVLKHIRVPKSIREQFAMPRFPAPSVPTRAQWNDVMAWMVRQHIFSTPPAYEESVNRSFLPKP